MKTAIVYYSMSGNVQYAAGLAAQQLDADLIPIRPVKSYPDKGFKKFLWGGKSAMMKEEPELEPYTFEGDRYERVIIGTPVWAGTLTPPIRTFIKENRQALAGKRIAAFASCSGAGGDKTLAALKELLGVAFFEADMVLIDPKDRPSAENEEKIRAFCEALK